MLSAMKVNNHLAFPTVISQTEHTVSFDEKQCWFDLYLKHSDSDGKSHDFVGFESLQTDFNFCDIFMNKLKAGVDEYFKYLNLSLDKLDVQLTKAFFNVTDQSGINIHDHAENHLSFTYYPHIARGKDRNIVFHNYNESHTNEPYPSFFYNHITEWTGINSAKISYPISEGVLFIFPSKLKHDIEVKQGDTQPDVQSFKDKQSLERSRFCVAGDMLYTRKPGIEQYNRTLSSPENWRTV
jgi:hypothetical protein|tara:strand:- start:24 stop:740 length:717 start_codon:yes stop_codon:yes gene_type:complete